MVRSARQWVHSESMAASGVVCSEIGSEIGSDVLVELPRYHVCQKLLIAEWGCSRGGANNDVWIRTVTCLHC